MYVIPSPHGFERFGSNHDYSSVQGGEQYQSAFYVYEELAAAPSTTAALSTVGQAVAELHLGRIPEAEAALSAALEKYPDDVELIANTIVLNVLAGKPTEELESYVPFFSPSLPEHLRLTVSQTSSAGSAIAYPFVRYSREERAF